MKKTTDKKELKSKLLTAAVIAVLCLIFVVGFIWGLNSVLAMEGSYPPDKDTHGVYEEPKTNEEVIKLLNDIVKDAVDGKPKTSSYSEFDIDKGSITVDGSEELKKTVLFAADGFADTIKENSEKSESDFSQELKLRVPQITANDIESFECKYFARNYIYQCDICGAESDELLNGCPECGSGNLYVESGRGEYVINIVLKNNETVIEKNFPERNDAEIRELLGDDVNKSETFDVNNIAVKDYNLELSLRINRETGELTYLEYKEDMTAKADITFKGDFEKLGKTSVEFKVGEKLKNELTWPSLALSEEEMIIEPKKSDNLTATLTCSDPTKPVVTWTSSDENVVTIDDEGYMKAGKEPGESTITATFEFNGKTYSDTCVVSVKVPVESMKISKRSMNLEVGKTAQLKAEVSPAKATVQTKTWYSEDESIATVDENGLVTAVKSGTVVIYALSDDEYFKSSCEVTVK